MNITASVNYHVTSTQPQAFCFEVDGIVGNLVTPELVATRVEVKDCRDGMNQIRFDDEGVAFLLSESVVSHFTGDDWQAQYDQEIADLLTRHIGAKEVLVFDHTVRIDAQDADRKPARNVHNDFSAKGAQQRLIDLLGQKRAEDYQQGQFGFVNVWRPLVQSITSSPLGFIRPTSMAAEDWMTIELIYPDRQGQILGVAENPDHEWFYLSNMTPDEVAIFNVYDNRHRPHLAHSALDVVGQEATTPRKSIETRTLVRYS
ncbi:CmcJ/NvfI family oxidoreductase [Marinomonas posidonica]|uniref:CmcJ/NvfI family oxidoreductase n=1 Tax=Marinomonas posidonica TaxID=936476 RepID=UPI0037364F50